MTTLPTALIGEFTIAEPSRSRDIPHVSVIALLSLVLNDQFHGIALVVAEHFGEQPDRPGDGYFWLLGWSAPT